MGAQDLLSLHHGSRTGQAKARKKQRNEIFNNGICSDQLISHLSSLIFELKYRHMDIVKQFNDYRGKMNEKIADADNLILKRIFNLDTNAYMPGVLDVKTKELIGLTCSLVLRCDDCVKYHLGKCKEVGLDTKQVNEAMGVATLIGGTIVIPHLRRAFEYWEALQDV